MRLAGLAAAHSIKSAARSYYDLCMIDDKIRSAEIGDYRSADSYSRWVGRAIRLARQSDLAPVNLFESSVPEPRMELRNAIAALIEPDFGNSYCSAFAGGNPRVLEMLAESYGVSSEQVLCTTGATGSLSLLFRTFGKDGAHALIETPGFDLFGDLARDRGMAYDTFRRTAPDYSIDLGEISALLRPETRLIVLSNLHNPSGLALQHETLVQLARMAEEHGALLVVDEVYGDYADAEARPCPASTISPSVVSISSLTKIFGLATLRCGWIVGAGPVIADLRDVDSRLEFGRSNLAHAVAAQVLQNPQPFGDHTRGILANARPIIEEWFSEMSREGLIEGVLPRFGCIVFPRLVGIGDTDAFATELIQTHRVIVAPGEYFGSPGCVRIGFGLPPLDLQFGLASLSEALKKHRESPRHATAKA